MALYRYSATLDTALLPVDDFIFLLKEASDKRLIRSIYHYSTTPH